MVPVYLLIGEAFLLLFGTTFFHSSAVPVFIVFPGVSSEGEDSYLLIYGVVIFLLRGLRNSDVLGPQICQLQAKVCARLTG